MAGQDIGAWQSPVSIWNSTRMNSDNEIIVDSKDKEAWPSIGDKSETASEAGDTDNASVKSGSVISSSSNPGQSQLMGDSGQGSSAIQAPSASSVWGASLSEDSNKTMVSKSSWGQAQTKMTSGGWGLPSPTTGAESGISMNNQESNMQRGQNSVADTNIQSNESSLGWVLGAPQQGSRDLPISTGAPGITRSGGFTSTSGGNNPMQWTNLNFTNTLTGLDKAANQDSMSWDSVAKESSVIGSGLNNSSGASGANVSKNSAYSSQWGNNLPDNSGWGQPQPNSNVSSGWGSPSASPNPNAGTEGWGQPSQTNSNAGSGWNSQQPEVPQAQQQQPTSQPQTSSVNWDQASGSSGSSGAGWNEGSQPPSTATDWGQQSQSSSTSSWGQLDMSKPQNPGAAAWGQSDTNRSQSQWGPSGASQWGNSNQPTANPNSQQTAQQPSQQHPHGAWGSGNPFTNTTSNSATRVTQSVPPTWAQAALKGLPPNNPPKPDIPGNQGASGAASFNNQPVSSKDEFIAQAINDNEGWGKRPVCQDTAWDLEESPKPQRKVSTSSSDSANNENQWTHPNNGTSIWEGNKDSGTSNWGKPHPQPQPANSLDWVSDNDGKEWQGPPGSQQHMNQSQPPPNAGWGAPPQAAGGMPPQGAPPNSNWGSNR